jgi:hypothetical protein
VLFLLFCLPLLILGFAFLSSQNSFPSASAVEATGGIGVYWDESCSHEILSIDWGTIPPGGISEIVVFVRNEQSESIFLSVYDQNWNPSSASQYLPFSWKCTNIRIRAGEVIPVTQRLAVSIFVRNVVNFNFDTLFIGRRYPPGDVTMNYKIDMRDISYIAKRFGIDPTDPLWDSNADLNMDNKIDMQDVGETARNYGEEYQP